MGSKVVPKMPLVPRKRQADGQECAQRGRGWLGGAGYYRVTMYTTVSLIQLYKIQVVNLRKMCQVIRNREVYGKEEDGVPPNGRNGDSDYSTPVESSFLLL